MQLRGRFALTAAAVVAQSSALSHQALPASSRLESSALVQDHDGSEKRRPVTKVIDLLKGMSQQLGKEAEEDQEIYDKLACWCETNDKEKSKAIGDAEARVTDLSTLVEQLAAVSSRLHTEIESLEKEVASEREALDQATSIREKQSAAFNSEEKDMLQAISALGSAITVLGKHHAFVQGAQQDQISQTEMLELAAMIQHQVTSHAPLFKGVLTPSARRLIASFAQSGGKDFAPQSGEIFGILKQMKETFEDNLQQSQKNEMADSQGFQDLKAAKMDQITAAQTQLDTKKQILAEKTDKHAQANEDIEDTRTSLSADEEFLMMLKERCSGSDQAWELRQRTRQEEMQAVSKALAVLSHDDAQDTFARTFNPTLLQVSSIAGPSASRTKASELLQGVAQKLGNSKLAALAGRVQLDTFERVKEAIDGMVAQLATQQKDEVKHKDYCVDELNSNQLQSERKTREKESLLAHVTDLGMTVKQLGDAIDGLKGEITEMQVQMKRAGEDRQKQNSEFQSVLADQRAAQGLLQQALHVLQQFYEKKSHSGAAAASALEEREAIADVAAKFHDMSLVAKKQEPAGFNEYQKSSGAGGAVGLLEQILSDTKSMEAETMSAEQAAQKTYEELVKETNSSVETKNEDIVDKTKTKARAEGNLVEANEDKSNLLLELEQLSNSEAQLHGSCDFILKNFEVRQTGRSEEIDALKQAKAILSGSNFEEFLQS